MFDHPPHLGMIDEVIAVDQHIAERNNAVGIRNVRRNGGIVLSEPVHCLADDLEISLDGLAQETIILVRLGGEAASAVEDERRRVADVVKLLPCPVLHR